MPGLAEEEKLLHDAPDFRVRFVGRGNSRVCFVTFDSLTDTPDLDRPAFAEHFLREQGIDALHVVNRTNVWYAYDDFEAAVEKIRQEAKRYERVVTYGSSMGGYAAIRWAERVGATTAIAISPQYSVSKRLAPFEHRWRPLVYGLPRIQNEETHGSQSVTPIVLYDPADRDSLHFELIRKNYPRAIAAPMPNAGHPAGAMLSETGLLPETILSVLAGAFDEAQFVRQLRGRRHASGQYLFTLARRTGPKQMRLKHALASAAVRANRDGAYMIYAGLVAERLGDAHACERWLREAATILHEHPVVLRALTAFSLRHRRAAEAVDFAARLCAVDPQPHHRHMQAAALAVAGRMADARLAVPSYRIDPLMRISLWPVLAGIVPGSLLEFWWVRKYRIEAEFARADGWRERIRLRRLKRLGGN